jgi:hypothetical protein
MQSPFLTDSGLVPVIWYGQWDANLMEAEAPQQVLVVLDFLECANIWQSPVKPI